MTLCSAKKVTKSQGRLVLPGFESYYKFTWEKMISTHIRCVGSGIKYIVSLTLLLVNCNDITSRIFDQ